MKNNITILLSFLVLITLTVATSYGQIKPIKRQQKPKIEKTQNQKKKTEVKKEQNAKKTQSKKNNNSQRHQKRNIENDVKKNYYLTSFSCNATSARLYIDGSYMGDANSRYSLEEGSHFVKITCYGYIDHTAVIEVSSYNRTFSYKLLKNDRYY